MPIDPALGFSLADLASQSQQYQARQLQMEKYRADLQHQSQLGSLLPQALHGDQSARDQLAQVDPETYFKVEQHIASLGKTGAEREGKKWQAAAPVLMEMKAMPYEDRRGFLQAAAPALLAQGWTQEELQNFDPTDLSIKALGSAGTTVAQVLESQKITWHQEGERPSFATDSMGNPVGAGNPYAGGAVTSNLPLVNSPEEARSLPPGSQFRTPDGRTLRVPGGTSGNAGGGFPG